MYNNHAYKKGTSDKLTSHIQKEVSWTPHKTWTNVEKIKRNIYYRRKAQSEKIWSCWCTIVLMFTIIRLTGKADHLRSIWTVNWERYGHNLTGGYTVQRTRAKGSPDQTSGRKMWAKKHSKVIWLLIDFINLQVLNKARSTKLVKVETLNLEFF